MDKEHFRQKAEHLSALMTLCIHEGDFAKVDGCLAEIALAIEKMREAPGSVIPGR